MEFKASSSLEIQESLQDLTLEEDAQEIPNITEKVLVGKVLSMRPFRRFTVQEIVSKNWRVKAKVQVEGLADNIFKFSFALKEDRDFIFKNRPWTINGAHMVLKEWSVDEQLEEITFNVSTFFLQIHGLPPRLLNEANAKRIASTISVILDSGSRLVVANRFLRIRVDISILNPLPAGFKKEKASGEEFWVQFRYEKLADFCFKCGMLSHVTGQCRKATFEMIQLKNGLSARLFGLWLNAERKETVPFRQVRPETDSKAALLSEGGVQSSNLDRGTSQHTARGESGSKRSQKSDLAVLEMGDAGFAEQRNDLHFTLKRQQLDGSIVLQKVKLSNVTGSCLKEA